MVHSFYSFLSQRCPRWSYITLSRIQSDHMPSLLEEYHARWVVTLLATPTGQMISCCEDLVLSFLGRNSRQLANAYIRMVSSFFYPLAQPFDGDRSDLWLIECEEDYPVRASEYMFDPTEVHYDEGGDIIPAEFVRDPFDYMCWAEWFPCDSHTVISNHVVNPDLFPVAHIIVGYIDFRVDEYVKILGHFLYPKKSIRVSIPDQFLDLYAGVLDHYQVMYLAGVTTLSGRDLADMYRYGPGFDRIGYDFDRFRGIMLGNPVEGIPSTIAHFFKTPRRRNLGRTGRSKRRPRRLINLPPASASFRCYDLVRRLEVCAFGPK